MQPPQPLPPPGVQLAAPPQPPGALPPPVAPTGTSPAQQTQGIPPQPAMQQAPTAPPSVAPSQPPGSRAPSVAASAHTRASNVSQSAAMQTPGVPPQVWERYRDKIHYQCENAVTQLKFRVRVFKAETLDEEKTTEIIAERVVAWSERVLTPDDVIAIVKQEELRQAATLAAPGVQQAGATSQMSTEQQAALEVVKRCGAPHAPMREKLLEYLDGVGQVVTRPPNSDIPWHDPEDALPLTEPEMELTPLADPMSDRMRFKRGQCFHINWMVGLPKVDPVTGDVTYNGLERNMMTLTPEKKTGSFTARPSLGEIHTIHADAKQIWTFTVDLDDGDQESTSGYQSPPDARRKSRRRSTVVVGSSAEQQQVDDPITRQKRVLLRQAVTTRIEGGTSRTAASAFALPPERGKLRVHAFGTIQAAKGVQEGSLFCRPRWSIPEGWETCDGFTLDEMNTSQLALAALVELPEGEMAHIHTFNHPFEAHVVGTPSAGSIQMVVEVHSSGSGEDFQKPAGYGVVTVPLKAGMYKEHIVPLWVPKPTGAELLRSLFVGGGPSLADPIADVLGRNNGTNPTNSAAGLQTVASGELWVDMMVVTHQTTH